jgi:hypothetical protein
MCSSSSSCKPLAILLTDHARAFTKISA